MGERRVKEYNVSDIERERAKSKFFTFFLEIVHNLLKLISPEVYSTFLHTLCDFSCWDNSLFLRIQLVERIFYNYILGENTSFEYQDKGSLIQSTQFTPTGQPNLLFAINIERFKMNKFWIK